MVLPATPHQQHLRNPTGGSIDTTDPMAGEHTMKVTTAVPIGTGRAGFSTVDRAASIHSGPGILVRAGANPPLDAGAADGSDGQVDRAVVSVDDRAVDRYSLPERPIAPDPPLFTQAPVCEPAGDLATVPTGRAAPADAASSVTASGSGPDAGERRLGRAVDGDGDGERMPGTTVVRVDA